MLLLFLLVSSGMQFAMAGIEVGPDKQLTGKIDYWFVGYRQQTDAAGRLLVWEATIEGDLQGKMKWRSQENRLAKRYFPMVATACGTATGASRKLRQDSKR
jgi:hypothetical protein